MLRTMVFAISLIVIASQAFALTEARLLNQSRSGQTVVFNIGFLDGMKQGDYAVVVKQIKSLDSRDLRLVPVAKARNIKLGAYSSVWILYRIYDQDLLVKGDKFNVLSETFMLRGRKEPLLGRITLVNQKKSIVPQTQDFLSDDKDRISKIGYKYEQIAPTHTSKPITKTDADLVDVEVWEQNKESRYRSSLYKGPNKEEWNKQLRLATFEKLVTAYIQRVNDPDFNYDSFYEKQKKSQFANEFVARSDYQSEYGKFLRRESVKSNADAKLYRSILERGESWSEDYSDEELRQVLGQVSVLQEKDRRDWVVLKPTRYLVALDYGSYLSNSQTDKDPRYARDNRYSMEGDFEFTPILKHPDLERFTLNGTFRLNHNAFEASSLNADLDEYSVSMGANWYPHKAPYTVETPVFLIGTYLRAGYARAHAPTVAERANYTLLSFPGIRTGFKYLMRNNFGIRLLLSLETLKLDRYEVSKFNSILPETTNLVESKLSFGLAYAF